MEIKTKVKSLINEIYGKNKNMLYLLPILVIVIIIAVIAFAKGGKATLTANNNIQSNTSENGMGESDRNEMTNTSKRVEVLPQTERKSENQDDDNENSKNNNPVNPFALPMKVTGIMLGKDGQEIAIIESSQSSYIVKTGDVIEDVWKVSKIEENGVTLLNGEKETYVSFEK